MHLLLLPFVAIGLTSKYLSRRLVTQNAEYDEQLQIDYIFASIVNSIDLEDEPNEKKQVRRN